MKISNITKKIITIICAVTTIWMIAVIVRASSYSVFVTDDFVIGANSGSDLGLWQYFKNSVKLSIQMYTSWQGSYFGMFLQSMLSPLNGYGFAQLKVIMIINGILILFSALFFVLVLFRNYIKNDYHIVSIILFSTVFMILGYKTYTHIFFWYTGFCFYGAPIALALIGASFCILSEISDKKRRIMLVLAIVCGLCSMGGALTITGLGCYCILLINLFSYLKTKKINRSYLIIFAAWLIFALVNAAAPGNFVRHSKIDDTGVHVIHAIYDSLLMCESRFRFFSQDTNYAFILVVLVICGLYIGRNTPEMMSKKIRPHLITAVCGLLAPVVTAYPASLGYSTQNTNNRLEFSVDMAIIFSSVFLAVVIGIYLSDLFKENAKAFTSIICLTACVCFMLDGFNFSKIKIKQIYDEINGGIYSEYYSEYLELYDYIRSQEKGTDVVVPLSVYPEPLEDHCSLILNENPENYYNSSLAGCFGYNSIRLEEKPEE